MPDDDIVMEPLTSSNVDAAGYSDDTRTLKVQFKDGSVYAYYGVGREVFEGLMSSPSPGQFIHRHIKGFYSHTRES